MSRNALRTPLVGLLLLLATHPALAQSPAAGASSPALTAPPPAPMKHEIGLGILQAVTGVVASYGLILAIGVTSNGFEQPGPVVVGLAAEPAMVGLIVCGIGRGLSDYEGGCAPAVVGGYLGAAALGIPLGIYFAASNVAGGDDGEVNGGLSFALGAVLGAFFGTAIGATIGWNAAKHPHDPSAPGLRWVPPPPPPAEVTGWNDLRPRGRPALAVVGFPVVSLQF